MFIVVAVLTELSLATTTNAIKQSSADSIESSPSTSRLLNPQQPSSSMKESIDTHTSITDRICCKTTTSLVSRASARTANRVPETVKMYVCPYCYFAIPVRMTTKLDDFMSETHGEFTVSIESPAAGFRGMQQHSRDRHGASWKSQGNVLSLEEAMKAFSASAKQMCLGEYL